MKITADSELMKNQKHAVVMGQQQNFQVLQTARGDALFFSIGTDDVLYLTSEVRESGSGWLQVDLSSQAVGGSAGAKAKTFAVSQNPETMNIDVSMVLTNGSGEDALFISRDNSTDRSTWADGIAWAKVPFDAGHGPAPSPLRIADVHMLTQPSGDGGPGVLTWFVDIVRNPGEGFQLLERFYVEPDSKVKWVKHTLPNDVEEGSISSCLGRRQGDAVDGIYTFGKVGGSLSLIFTPKKNVWSPRSPPTSSRLGFPAGATAISSSLDDQGLSSLFVAAEGGLYHFKPGQQKDGATPSLIIPSSPVCNTNTFAGATHLRSSTVGSLTAVWGLNARRDLVCVTCPAGHEAEPRCWSLPMRIHTAVSRFSFYLNIRAPTNILFALVGDGNLLQLSQDPAVGTWTQRRITLPALDNDKVFETSTFTTVVKVADENGLPVADQVVTIKSAQTASLNVNNIYRKIDLDSRIETRTDGTGSVTIVQDIRSLPAVILQIKCEDQTIDIDPQAKIAQRLSTIQSSKDLDNVRIKTEDGKSRPLVPSDVSQRDKDTVAKVIPQLLNARSKLPEDGSAYKKDPNTAALKNQQYSVCGVSCADGLQFLDEKRANEHLEGLKSLPISTSYAAKSSAQSSSAGEWIESSAADLLSFLKDQFEAVQDFFVKAYEEVSQFVVRIGNVIYTAILDCYNAVSEAIEFVFTKIKVFFQDLIQWLGFLFDWDDILRTHRVIKNIITQYAKQAVDKISDAQEQVKKGFGDVRGLLESKEVDKIEDSGQTIGQQQQDKVSSVPGNASPQNNWAVYHANNGLTSLGGGGSASAYDTDGVDNLLSILENAVRDEGKALEDAFQRIKDNVVSKIGSLSPIQVIQEVFKIIGIFLIDTAENIVLKLLDLAKLFISGLFGLLDDAVNIPILSPLYKLVTKGDSLSCLDLICLIAAIPGTIVYKLVANSSPFPDSQHTKLLIEAPDFATLSMLLSETDSSSLYLGAGTHKTAAGTAVAASPAKVVTAVLKCSVLFINHINVGFAYAKRELMVSGKIANGISIALWLAAATPTISSNFPSPGNWTYVSDTLLAVGLCKTVTDNSGLDSPVWKNYLSPTLAAILALTALAPAVGGYVAKDKRKTSDDVGLVASICSTGSGVLTFFTPLKTWGPEISAPAFAVSMGLSLLGGGFSAASGAAVLMEAGNPS